MSAEPPFSILSFQCFGASQFNSKGLCVWISRLLI